ncbi:hypothetical protein QFZ82_000244 [Streptomyces sp. V4I23]|nr:hypothetical protein [Streptomyces sp. V4I23]
MVGELPGGVGPQQRGLVTASSGVFITGPGEPCREARTPVVPVGYTGPEPTALPAVGEGAHRLMTDAANTLPPPVPPV